MEWENMAIIHIMEKSVKSENVRHTNTKKISYSIIVELDIENLKCITFIFLFFLFRFCLIIFWPFSYTQQFFHIFNRNISLLLSNIIVIIRWWCVVVPHWIMVLRNSVYTEEKKKKLLSIRRSASYNFLNLLFCVCVFVCFFFLISFRFVSVLYICCRLLLAVLNRKY